MTSATQLLGLLKQTYSEWSNHQAPRLGASVAFYSILSFAPLLILITAIIGLVFGHEHAQGALIGEASQLIGDRGADAVQNLLRSAQKPKSGAFAGIVAFLTLLFGASGVFAELQDALNLMWDVKGKAASGFLGLVKQRLFSFGMVLSIGFLLLVSLLLSAALAFLGHSFGQLVPVPPAVLEVINFIVSFAVIAVLFALMFKYVPDAKVPWKDAVVGAVGTALLFTIGKLLLGLYLGKAGVGSAYGAAGSLVAVVVWIYYSAQIFFFGAEFTHLYSKRGQANQEAPEELKAAGAPVAKAEVAPLETKAEPAHAAMAMIARVGSVTPAVAPVPVRTVEPPAPLQVIEKPAIERPRIHANTNGPSLRTEKTKPELLLSLAVGFVLGRVFSRLNHQSGYSKAKSPGPRRTRPADEPDSAGFPSQSKSYRTAPGPSPAALAPQTVSRPERYSSASEPQSPDLAYHTPTPTESLLQQTP